MARPQRPSQREEFEIAIICALPLEYDAVSLLFDRFWDESGDQYGRAVGDPNYYTTGQIGNYNVVLALLPNMGKASAAAAAANLRLSYPGLKLAFLAGICGGAPKHPETGDEILLGDVVISKIVVQYDFGRQIPGHFVRKDTLDDNLGRPDRSVRSLLAVLQTELGRERLQQQTAQYLRALQDLARGKKRRGKYLYPGTAEDKLFDPRYRHKHHSSSIYGDCRDCSKALDSVCTKAYDAICTDIPCNEHFLVPRERLDMKQRLEQERKEEAQDPAIHIGRVASGDMVMKSGAHRGMLTQNDKVIAFEMESAGIWDEIRSVVVKGVCDYADSHKNKKWQDFAALTSASTVKALLERWNPIDGAVRSVVSEGG
ncbi:purine and uridine phosphorylase [Aspergillus novoparasiticus]|uniref:Purine and uridine phosphorylase n=1 Tax=Aspergillus novoparasiticus TaxID=986946 RepID=A0A5N6F3P0_9EURO|nr:purine and uridine phosphorylase [Aspergillus novoparasiticus]